MIRLFLLRFSESYFRHRWLNLLPTLLLIIAAIISIIQIKPKYIAHGIIYVQKESFLASLTSIRNNDTNIWLSAAQATANEINDLIQTDAFVRAIIFNTDLEAKMSEIDSDAQQLISDTRESIWVTVQGDNQVEINAAMENPQAAVQAVNAIMESYIKWRINGQRAESESAEAFFNEQIQKYKADLANSRQVMENYILENPAPIQGDRSEIENMEIDRLQKDIDILESRMVSALDKEENARLALAQIESDIRQSYTIIDAPRLPEKPEISKKDLALQIGIFLAIGIILDIAAVVGWMLLDRSIIFPQDASQSLSLPVLAVVPDVFLKTPHRVELIPQNNQPARKSGKKAKRGAGTLGISAEPEANIESKLKV